QDPLTKQKLIEANEIVRVPRVTYDLHLPDSINSHRADSLRKEAALLLEIYSKNRERYERLSHEADTLKKVYEASVEKVNQYRRLTAGSYVPGAGDLPAGQRWLLGVRSFWIGRNNINTSELTARNLSL